MSLLRLAGVLKHMSGKHNQKLHGRKSGTDAGNDMHDYEGMYAKLQDMPPTFDPGTDSAGNYHNSIADAYVYKLSGYDSLPTTVSDVQFNKLPKSEIMYRGISSDKSAVSADDAIRQFKSGTYFSGRGSFGNGVYAAYGNNAASRADTYTGISGKVMRLALKPDAKIIDYDTIRREMNSHQIAIMEYTQKLEQPERNKAMRILSRAYGDVGTYAALAGYDAIDVPTMGEKVVLNRGAVIVPESD